MLSSEDAGRTVQLTATIKDRNRQVITAADVSWSSDDGHIVQVSEEGPVKGGEPGTTIVEASVATLAASATITVAPGPRTVLQKFYREAGGGGWTNNANWTTDAPIYMCYGVRIDTLEKITALFLPDNGLTGTIPPEVGMLRNLEHLWFSNNRMTGPIPERARRGSRPGRSVRSAPPGGRCRPGPSDRTAQGMRGGATGRNPVAMRPPMTENSG